MAAAIPRVIPNVYIYSAIPSLGEGVGADGLWQIIIAAQMLITKSCRYFRTPLPVDARQAHLSRRCRPRARSSH